MISGVLIILTLCGAANAFQSEWRRKFQTARYSPCTGVDACTSYIHTVIIVGNVRGEREAEEPPQIPQGRDGRDGRDGLSGPQGPPGQDCCSEPPVNGGVTYVRWGRTTCPGTPGTELVYTGRAAGSRFNQQGGGSNYQCVSEEPENFDFGAGTSESSLIWNMKRQQFALINRFPSSTRCPMCSVLCGHTNGYSDDSWQVHMS